MSEEQIDTGADNATPKKPDKDVAWEMYSQIESGPAIDKRPRNESERQ